MSGILVTGASSGLGWALAQLYAEPGATLHLVARRSDRLRTLAPLLVERGARPVLHEADVRDRARMEELAQEIMASGGPPALIVANAGIRGEEEGNDHKTMETVFSTNVMGVLNTILPFLPALKKEGRGRIAVVGSLAGYRGLPKAGAYCASKSALSAWTDAIRYEAEPFGVTVSLINPGYVVTEMTRRNPYPMPFILTAPEAARRIRAGLDRGRARIEFPLPLVLLVRTLALLPPRLGDRLLRLASGR
jgi:short-subunit dehydrogenase